MYTTLRHLCTQHFPLRDDTPFGVEVASRNSLFTCHSLCVASGHRSAHMALSSDQNSSCHADPHLQARGSLEKHKGVNKFGEGPRLPLLRAIALSSSSENSYSWSPDMLTRTARGLGARNRSDRVPERKHGALRDACEGPHNVGRRCRARARGGHQPADDPLYPLPAMNRRGGELEVARAARRSAVRKPRACGAPRNFCSTVSAHC